MLNPIFKKNVQGGNIQGVFAFAEPELLSYRKPNVLFKKKRIANKIKVIDHFMASVPCWLHSEDSCKDLTQ